MSFANGPTIVPLAVRAGVVAGATPALAFGLTQGDAQMPLRAYAAELAAAHRSVPARSTLERVGKALARTVARALPQIEPVVRPRAHANPSSPSGQRWNDPGLQGWLGLRPCCGATACRRRSRSCNRRACARSVPRDDP